MLSPDEKTQVRVNVALDMIAQAEDGLKVRLAVAYAVGYIDALCDERRISVDGAGLYRQDAFARRSARMAALGEVWTDDQPQFL